MTTGAGVSVSPVTRHHIGQLVTAVPPSVHRHNLASATARSAVMIMMMMMITMMIIFRVVPVAQDDVTQLLDCPLPRNEVKL